MADNNPGGAGSGSQASATFRISTSERQNAIVYDVLSEGPIQGLVNGPSSIFLNNTPLMEKTIQGLFSATTSSDISYNASTGIVTDNNSRMFTDRDADEGTYTILIEGAKKSSSGIASATAGGTTITTSSNFFAANDVSSGAYSLPQYVSLQDAGAAGCHYVGQIIEYVSATEVKVVPAITNTVSNKDISIDLVDTIASFSSNTATLENGGGISVSNVYGQLSSPTQTVQSTPKYNFEHASWAFRNGTRDQDIINGPGGLGSSSIVYNINDALPPTDFSALSGFGSNYFAAGGWTNVTEAVDTGFEVTSTTMGVSNPEEVDLVKISVKFPQGLYSHKAKSGAEGETFAELQIYFEYTRDGTNYISDLVVGPTDSQLSTRAINWGGRAGRPTNPSNGWIYGFNKTPFVKTFSINVADLQPFTDYRIKIKRVGPANAQNGDWVHYSATSLQAIENVITDKFSYPYTAYGAVSFSAQDFQDIPQRGYEIRGLKVKVPTNYFSRYELGSSTEAAYTRNTTTGANAGSYQDWDGNFRGDIKTFTSKTSPNYNPVWTDNPVWILMDILTNDRYGLGKYIDPDDDFSSLDKYQLFQLAKYCDELVPDGKGGQEPRFSCNVYLRETQEAQKTIKDLMQVFRGMLVWFDGQISPSINAYKSPIYTFTKGNVVGGEFGYQSTSRRYRSNQIRVTWNNPDNFYKQEVEIVEDFENIIETNRINPKEVVAFGCTSQGQAHRFGKWHLFTEKLDKEVVSFSTGLNAAFLKPGDVIEIQDADITSTAYSGRVSSSSSSTTTTVYLDRGIDLSASGQTFELNLIYPKGGAYLAQETATINSVEYSRGDLLLTDENGSAIDTEVKANNLKDDSNNVVQLFWSENARIETKTISSYNSSGDVTVSSAFSEAPNAGVIWSITNRSTTTGEKLSAAPKEYIVLNITENTNEQTFDITAANHSNEKYDLIDRGYVIEQVPQIRKEPQRTDLVPAPRNLSLSVVPSVQESLADTVDGNSSGLDLLVSWEHPQSQLTDAEGNNIQGKYEFLSGYEIRSDVFLNDNGQTISRKKIGAETSSYRFKNVRPDIYTIEVRTINNGGNYSKYIQKRINIVSGNEQYSSGSRLQSIPRGGLLNQALSIDSSSGLVSIGSSTYNFTSVIGGDFNLTSTGTDNYQQSFSGMGASSTAYLLFDASATSDHLKAIEVIQNTTAQDSDGNKLLMSYVAEVGASNDGLTAISGTITLAADSTDVIGSSTSFLSDFEEGDKIFFGSGTTLFTAKISFIDSDTKLQIDRTSTRSYSSATASKLSFKPNFAEDSIIAEVITDGSTNYSLNQIYAVTAGITGADGEDGSDGTDARAVNLTVGDQTIEYDTNNANPSPSSTTVTATALNTSDTVYYEFFKNDVSVQNTTSNTYSYSAPSSYTSMPEKIEVQIREGSNSGTILARDQITISGLKAGTDAITTILSNEAHTLPTTSGGVVTYTGSGTDIEVWNGTTQVPYDGSSPYASPSFRVSASGTTITPGSASTVSTYTRRFADHSNMTADNAAITYTIIVKNEAGVENTFTRKQTFAKSIQGADGSPGADGKTAKLTPSKFVINYSTAGAESDTITFTTDVAGFTTPYYRFLVDGVQKQAYSTTSTFTLSDADEPAIGETVNVKVEVKENNAGSVLATDTVTIYAVQDGSDAIIGFLTNAAHVVQANSSGTVSSFSGAGGTYKVFVGGTDVTSSCTFSVASETGVDVSINNIVKGLYSVSSMSANQGTATFQAVIPAATAGTASNVTITADYSISKSIAGSTGSTGPRTATGYIYYQSSSASSPTSGAAVSTSSVSYSFSTSLLTGGVIGTGSTNWNQNPPTFTGSNANKYWYAYYSVIESSYGGSYTVTFSIPYQGQNFTGLVTFTGTNTISDGTNTTTAVTATDLGSSGTTIIDGGRIETGTINANRITLIGKNISDLTNDENFIDAAGAPVQSVAGLTGAITTANLSSAGLFLTSSAGNLATQDTVNLGTQTSGTLGTGSGGTGSTTGPFGYATASAFISAESIRLTSNYSGFAAVATSGSKSDVGLGNVDNYSPSNQLINGWSTTITAGALSLGNSSGARIVLDATSTSPRILIVDAT